MARKAPVVAREGWPWLALAIGASAAALVYRPELAAIPLLLCVFLLLLFRDPRREIPSDPLAVICPVDGWVTAVEPTDRGVLEGEGTRITISINNFGAYTVRSPVEGKVLDLHETLTVRAAFEGIGGLWVRTDADEDFVLLLRRSLPGVHPAALVGYGQRIGQGQRCALVRLARRAELYLPIHCRIETRRGAYVRAGSDVLASIVRK